MSEIPKPPPGWKPVYLPERDEIKDCDGAVTIGLHIETGKYCISVIDLKTNSDAHLVVPRAALSALRDSLDRELAN